MSEFDNIFQRSIETTQKLGQGYWPVFLRTAAWNYRYSFPNQVLIYAQKPYATACASMEVWNNQLHRQVKPDATGIALIEDSGDTLGLSYIFDMTETFSPSNIPVPLWSMSKRKEEDVRIALGDAFLAGSHPYRDEVMEPKSTSFFFEIAQGACNQLADQSIEELLSIKDSCDALRDLTEQDLTFEFETLLQASVATVLMVRCGIEPDIDPSIWESAKKFGDIQAMAILGQATQTISRQTLDLARLAVRKWDKEHKEEINHEHRIEVSAGRGVQDPGTGHPSSEASEQVRQNAEEISEGEQAFPVYGNDVDRNTSESSLRDRGTDATSGRPSDRISSGSEPGSGEIGRQSDLDEAHGQDSNAGRRDGLSGDDLRLTDEEGDPLPIASEEGFDIQFPSSIEQEAFIRAAESSLNLSQEEINFVFSQILNSQGIDDSLITLFQDSPNSDDAVSALKDAFGDLNEDFHLNVSEPVVAVTAKSYGIEVSRQGKYQIIPWKDFAVYFEREFADLIQALQKEENSLLPSNCDSLEAGQVFSLNGKEYRVISISESSIGLQDVKFPIFTNTIPRQTLDLLLKNNAPKVQEEDVPTRHPSEPEVSFPQPVENSEPLIDHPELIPRDLSRDARADKVVLADLLMHFADYKGVYARQMPPLSPKDNEAYITQMQDLLELAASDVPHINQQRIQETITFFNRWFLPVSDNVRESVRKEMDLVLNAANELLANWEQMGFENEIKAEVSADIPVQTEVPDPVPAVQEPEVSLEDIFHVGDFYEDEHTRGVITAVSPEAYEGRHRFLFSLVDPDAEPGSRASHGFVMDGAGAAERLFQGKATLIPATEWETQRSQDPEGERKVPDEPTLFDFSFDPQPEPSDALKAEKPAAPVTVNTLPEVSSEERINYRIPVEGENYGGPKARFQNNIAAIRLLKTLETEDRLATAQEQEILSRYVGWGGIPQAFDDRNQQWSKEFKVLKDLLTDDEYEAARESTLTAFYTPPAVTEAIFSGLRQLGFEGGNILDPCCGTGNFFGMLPEDMASSKLYGVELDPISGRIARQMYQNANIVIEGYEKTSLPDSMFDVAIGNVPFGNYQLSDKRYNKEHFLIHDYFFAKSLDKVRPGGVVAFVTSKGTMDKETDSFRRYIAQRADLLGAIRLPDNTFKTNAGTEAVADILFLQKRERPRVEEPDWVGLDRPWDPNKFEWGPKINAYFAENPEMVLGKLVEVTGPHGELEVTCKAKKGHDLRADLQKAVQNIEGSIVRRTVDLNALDEANEKTNYIPADPNVRNYSFTVVDGDIYFREDSVMFRSKMNKTAEKRVKGMVVLRTITRDLIEAQMENAPDEQIESLQARLNTAYDAFTDKFGLINSTANSRAFSDDDSYYLLCSLENFDTEGNYLGKAKIFTQRTIGYHKVPEHVETSKEALAISMGELARVDLDFMSRLSDISREKLLEDLKGLIFPLPADPEYYQISSLYLSGNIREKLEEAKEAAKDDPRFSENVAYLEQAMPEPLTATDISVRIGSTWIPCDVYRDFIEEHFGLPYWAMDHIQVQYEPYTSSWGIVGKNLAPAWSQTLNSVYGTGRINALDILDKTLNMRDIQIFDTKTGPDGESQRILNTAETLAAQEKQQAIRDAFQDWIWKDPDRRERLCKIYNDNFNCIVPPSFSADLVQFHGLNPLIELDDHQKESVARIIYNGNTLLAHCVGAGKTWTMTAAGMEMKYLGLCNKNMVVVPNHLIGQWAAAIYDAYPQANVLAASEKDFEPARRKKFCSRIATGDYDFVIIGHSHFEKIPLSAERQETTIQNEIDNITKSIRILEMENGEEFSVKKLEQAKKRLETKLDRLHNAKTKDNVVTFEELGVDRLFVDESHNYKNLFISSKMHNVAGISQTDSQKASDMFVKCRYMDELTGNKGNIHATGTPLSNTMAELYTSKRYLMYDELQKMGLGAFDAWASTFGETVVSLELAPEGTGYYTRTRFARFHNVPELMNLYKQVADIRTKDMLNLPVPKAEYEVEVLKPSQEQIDIVKSLGSRAEKIRRGGVDNREDNMLCITNDGRKAALDQRLIDPSLPDDPNSKVVACSNSVYNFYVMGNDEKLTQLVFCDLSTPNNQTFNVYDDLKAKLVARGVPADEIRFIHEAKTVAQKEALFAKVRSGAVRVLMGSTQKMGTGTCVQDRVIAVHDLDAPWRPSDLEQRDGRGVRRGNMNDAVKIRRYVKEGTFDAYIYQLLEAKQRFTDQIFTSKNPARSIEDVGGAALDFAEIKALSSGDERIKEKITLEIEIGKLEMLKNRHQAEKFRNEHKVQVLPVEIKGLEERLDALKADNDLVSSQPSRTSDGKLIPACIKGVTFEKQEQTGNAILQEIKNLQEPGKWITIGTLRGFQIQGMKTVTDDRGSFTCQLALFNKCRYPINLRKDMKGQGIMMSLNFVLDSSIGERSSSTKKTLRLCKQELALAQAEVGKPFESEALLREKKSRLAVLDEVLNLDLQEKEGAEPDKEIEVIDSGHGHDEPSGQRSSLDDLIAGAQRASQVGGSGTGHQKDFSYSH